MTKDLYKSIDGNMIRTPVGYCTRYKGYLSQKQEDRHMCKNHNSLICGRLQTLEGGYVSKMTREQFYDKIISRMDKLILVLEKITKELQKNLD